MENRLKIIVFPSMLNDMRLPGNTLTSAPFSTMRITRGKKERQ
jgi:hypothetical protein